MSKYYEIGVNGVKRFREPAALLDRYWLPVAYGVRSGPPSRYMEVRPIVGYARKSMPARAVAYEIPLRRKHIT